MAALLDTLRECFEKSKSESIRLSKAAKKQSSQSLEEAAKLYKSVSLILYASISLAQLEGLEKYLNRTLNPHFDFSEWIDVLDSGLLYVCMRVFVKTQFACVRICMLNYYETHRDIILAH